MLMDVRVERVEGWAEELVALTGGLGHLFVRQEPREVFADLIEGLLSDLGRKNGWTMAGRAGHATPHRIQKFLGEASWSANGLLAEVQAYAARELGDPSATLVLDDTQVMKKGDKSVGVGHQHCGTTGDVRNCQVMVMLTYAAASGHTFYDRRLYLPQSWTGDREPGGRSPRRGRLRHQAVAGHRHAAGRGGRWAAVLLDGCRRGLRQGPRSALIATSRARHGTAEHLAFLPGITVLDLAAARALARQET